MATTSNRSCACEWATSTLAPVAHLRSRTPFNLATVQVRHMLDAANAGATVGPRWSANRSRGHSGAATQCDLSSFTLISSLFHAQGVIT
jgi:hypothetical protein